MLESVVITVCLFLGLLAGLNAGRALGRRMRGGDEDDTGAGTSAAEGVVFAVLGLLIAFTFTASASRFDERRRLIVQQANALGTANLRLDMLEADDRVAIHARMRDWLDVVVRTPALASDSERLKATVADAERIQNDVWRLSVAAIERKRQPGLALFVLVPQNEWIDLTTTRMAMNHLGLPPMVLPTLVGMSVVGSVLAGFSMSRNSVRRRGLHMVAFAGVITLSIYVIMDLNHPRSGLIKIGEIDQTMLDLRRGFDSATAPAATEPAK